MRLYLSSFGLGRHPEELLALLRGGRRAGLILNAKDGSSAESRARSVMQETEALQALGLEVREIDLREFFGAPEQLRSAIGGLDLLWVRGGNVFVLQRALRQSGADVLLAELLRTDVMVYGGFSAGVSVLTSSLRGKELVDDPGLVPEGYEAEPTLEGLGILPYAVAPHYRSDHPESPSIERLVQYYIEEHVPFLALRDGEAIVVDGDRNEVVR